MFIGGWQVDIDKNQLRNGESVITLRNKVMGVLVYLAKNADRLVSRDELIDEIWLGNYPVGKKGLTNAVWQLRIDLQAIEQHSGSSQDDAILTVPKKGYQLLLPVIADECSTKDNGAKYETVKDISAKYDLQRQPLGDFKAEENSDSLLTHNNTNSHQLKKGNSKKSLPRPQLITVLVTILLSLVVFLGLMTDIEEFFKKQSSGLVLCFFYKKKKN